MEGSALFFFFKHEYILNLDLPSLCEILLPKLQPMDLENSSSTVMISYTTLILIKELTSQQMEHGNEPMIMEFTSFTISPIILKWLAW